MKNNHFSIRVRIYYEDTDAGGVVYHANYLKYMERARSEWLREMGWDVQKLEEEFGIIFAINKVQLEYLSPARLNDELLVSTELIQIGKVRLSFKQNIYNDGKLITTGMVKVAVLNNDKFKFQPIPNHVFQEMQKWLQK